MATTLQTGEQRTLLRNIAWQTFLDLCEQREGPVPRMTYDRGELELMSPRRQHEELGCFIGPLQKGIDIRSVASTTFKRSDLSRAFEADKSYYIQNVESIWRKEEVELAIDPPPDLVIEIELTSSAIAKIPLFAAMGIPEVWRHNGSSLEMLSLVGEEYQAIDQSVQLPGLTPAMIDSVLSKRFEIGETPLIRQFRQSLG